jgi:hypothetical protein
MPRRDSRMSRSVACFSGALACFASVVATAQTAAHPPGDLVVSSTLERIVDAAAEGGAAAVRIAAATVASHADQLMVSVKFTNTGASSVDAVRITIPVPADVQYVPGSASGPGSEVLFSVDSGRTFALPRELKLPAADGRTRTAAASDYTHVRWVLHAPLDAGAIGVARFRAVPR